MSAARAMWTMFEPVHDVTYFAPEALSEFTEAGLRGYWRGYFAGRAAPLGGTRAAVVAASFFNFAPSFVARAVPGVWDLVTPAAAIAELPVSGEPLTRLWQATTLLREHRGDGHFAALAAGDIDGCEAVVLKCATDIPRDLMQPV